jgi:hypothetical protein
LRSRLRMLENRVLRILTLSAKINCLRFIPINLYASSATVSTHRYNTEGHSSTKSTCQITRHIQEDHNLDPHRRKNLKSTTLMLFGKSTLNYVGVHFSMKREAAGSSEILVCAYQSTRQHISENSNLDTRSCELQISHLHTFLKCAIKITVVNLILNVCISQLMKKEIITEMTVRQLAYFLSTCNAYNVMKSRS